MAVQQYDPATVATGGLLGLLGRSFAPIPATEADIQARRQATAASIPSALQPSQRVVSIRQFRPTAVTVLPTPHLIRPETVGRAGLQPSEGAFSVAPVEQSLLTKLEAFVDAVTEGRGLPRAVSAGAVTEESPAVPPSTAELLPPAPPSLVAPPSPPPVIAAEAPRPAEPTPPSPTPPAVKPTPLPTPPAETRPEPPKEEQSAPRRIPLPMVNLEAAPPPPVTTTPPTPYVPPPPPMPAPTGEGAGGEVGQIATEPQTTGGGWTGTTGPTTSPNVLSGPVFEVGHWESLAPVGVPTTDTGGKGLPTGISPTDVTNKDIFSSDGFSAPATTTATPATTTPSLADVVTAAAEVLSDLFGGYDSGYSGSYSDAGWGGGWSGYGGGWADFI